MAEVKTIQEFGEAVLAGVSVDIDDLPKGAMVSWFADPSTGKPTTFKVGEVHPFDPYSRVIGIFQSEETIRVYTLPAAPPTPRPNDWKDRPPTRYTLTRDAPTFVAETMVSLDVMAALLIEEWNVLGDVDSAEEEREAVTQWLREKNLVTLADAIEAGEHLERDEEPEGAPPAPEALKPPAAPTPPAPPAVTA